MSEAFEMRNEKPVREPFVVDNDMKAEWCLNKIRKVKAAAAEEIAELERQMNFYKNEIERIEEDTAEDVAFFTGILSGYFKSRVDDGFAKASKRQTVYKLPTGKLILKKREPDYDTKDKAFTEWLQNNGYLEYLKVEVSPKWGDFKKTLKGEDGTIKTVEDEAGIIRVVDKNGEIVPGVKVTPLDDEFVVEVN